MSGIVDIQEIVIVRIQLIISRQRENTTAKVFHELMT